MMKIFFSRAIKLMMNVRNAREVTIKLKSGYVALYVINSTMKTVFMSDLSHSDMLLDYN